MCQRLVCQKREFTVRSSSCDSFYWLAELNFGQEPVFFKRPYFKLFPEKLFSDY